MAEKKTYCVEILDSDLNPAHMYLKLGKREYNKLNKIFNEQTDRMNSHELLMGEETIIHSIRQKEPEVDQETLDEFFEWAGINKEKE